jgi:hypothetical protein
MSTECRTPRTYRSALMEGHLLKPVPNSYLQYGTQCQLRGTSLSGELNSRDKPTVDRGPSKSFHHSVNLRDECH